MIDEYCNRLSDAVFDVNDREGKITSEGSDHIDIYWDDELGQCVIGVYNANNINLDIYNSRVDNLEIYETAVTRISANKLNAKTMFVISSDVDYASFIGTVNGLFEINGGKLNELSLVDNKINTFNTANNSVLINAKV